jgi:hypothetical protein
VGVHVEWKLEHLVQIANQLEKRWASNPTSVTPSQDHQGSPDHDWIHVRDIGLVISLSNPSIWVDLKNYHGHIDRPRFYHFIDRKVYDDAMAKIRQVQLCLKEATPGGLDRLICEAFPEEFEKFLGQNDKKTTK